MIYLIEGNRTHKNALGSMLSQGGYETKIFPNLSAAEKEAQKAPALPDLLIINTATMRSSGTRLCQQASQTIPVPLLLITETVKNGRLPFVNEVLNAPFTSRKLFNRIDKYLMAPDAEYMCRGPIRLHKEKCQVYVNGNVSGLTPKVCKLLRYLMDHEGQAVERQQLIRQVWETEYFGDTKTLDTHIVWLRKAIEIDSRDPKLLVTIRGVGYRLDLSAEK